jgi:hypothetical protein
MPEWLCISEFAGRVHSTFRVEKPIVLELELAQVNDHPNAEIEEFSLEYTRPQAPCLRQETYKLRHAELGKQDIFLVPLGPRGCEMWYQAIFTRLIGQSALKPAANA